MGGDTHDAKGFALLVSPAKDDGTYTLYVSSPPPAWLDGRDKTRLTVVGAGMYLLSYIVHSGESGRASISINGRVAAGSEAKPRHGEIFGSAVCTVRTPALPCTIGLATEGETNEGVFLIAKI